MTGRVLELLVAFFTLLKVAPLFIFRRIPFFSKYFNGAMKTHLVTSLVILLSLLANQCLAISPSNLCEISENAIKQASRIRGLTIKRKVPCVTQTKEQVKNYLVETIRTKLPAKKLSMEALVYKVLGFIPADFDYQEGLIQLYLDQIGGYYDPELDRYVMAAWMPAILQTPVAVHELTHALQDQYFDLGQIIDAKLDNSDALLARSALAEGDATAVMMDYSRNLIGQGPLAKERDVSGIMMQNLIGTSMLDSGGKVPSSLKMLLIFPYTSGLRFAHSLLMRGGYSEINRAFKRLPRSTEEILHVEKYLSAQADFVEVEDPPTPEADFIVEYRDTMGEFIISLILANYIQDRTVSTTAASGWGGDKVVVFNGPDDRKQVIWQTNWDSVSDAKEFYSAYTQTLKARSNHELEQAGSGVKVQIPNIGVVTISRNDSSVTVEVSGISSL